MMQAYGLRTHIWNNNLRSTMLLLSFPLLLLLVGYAFTLLFAAYGQGMGTEEGLVYATRQIPYMVPTTLGLAGGWFAVAFAGHQAMINMAAGSKSLTESEEPRAYKLLENLCISRGMTMPKLRVIHSPQLNAFASGIRDSNYTITLTSGLMQTLDDEELEAVIAHELSHIRNRDVRTLIIAIIFVGIFSFIGEIIFRGVMRTNLPRSDNHRRSGGGNAGALVLFAVAIIIVAYALAMFIRFSLSRKREYLADAGAVELTKNPDAMIRALEKISGRAVIDSMPGEVREMAIENPRVGFGGLFATHPPIEKRIEALVDFAGGRKGTQSRPDPKRYYDTPPEPKPVQERPSNPWTKGF